MGSCAAVAAMGRRGISAAPVAAAAPRVPSPVSTKAMVLMVVPCPATVRPGLASCVRGCVSRRSTGARVPWGPVLMGL